MTQFKPTATGYVLNRNHTNVLLVHHKKLDCWLPAGGHIEEGEMPNEAVLREVFEETGIKADFVKNWLDLELTNDDELQQPNPFCILKEIIPANEAREEKIYLDYTYILEADESELTKQELEVHDVGWFGLDEVNELKTYPSVNAVARKILK